MALSHVEQKGFNVGDWCVLITSDALEKNPICVAVGEKLKKLISVSAPVNCSGICWSMWLCGLDARPVWYVMLSAVNDPTITFPP